MMNVEKNNQFHNKEIAPPVHGDRKGKGARMSRRVLAVVVLLTTGFFIHDALWHAMLAVFGMNTIVGMEFGLPDLGAYHIYPDRAVQTFGFLFATVVASLLLWFGLRLSKRS